MGVIKGFFKLIFSLVLAVIILGMIASFFSSPNENSSSATESTTSEITVNWTLKCKYNRNAMYEDNLTFYKNGSIYRTSSNKSQEPKEYTYSGENDYFVISGTKTLSREGTTTELPDSKLFIAKKESSSSRNWGLYYYDDYATNPFKFMVCNEF